MDNKEVTPQTLKEAQENCTHLGTHNPVTQNVLQTSTSVFAVVAHNCAYCGKVFILLNPIDTSSIKKSDMNKLVTP